MRINAAGNVGIGTASPNVRLEVVASGAEVVLLNRTTSDGSIVSLRRDGSEEGTISVSVNTVSYNAFTGSHYGWTDRTINHGTLVTLTGDNRRLHDNAESEIIYGVAPSSVPNDPKILGAYLALQESNEPAGSENPHLVMAVGNGEMWVVDDGQDIEIGDYLISSDVAGHATVDRGDHEISNIVGRVAEPIDWNADDVSIDGRRHRRVSVFFESFTINHAADRIRAEQIRASEEIAALRSAIQEQQQTIEQQRETLAQQAATDTAMRVRMDDLSRKLELLVASMADSKTELHGSVEGSLETSIVTMAVE